MVVSRDGGFLSRLRWHQLFWTLLIFFYYFLFCTRGSFVAAALAPAFSGLCDFFLFFSAYTHTHTQDHTNTHTETKTERHNKI